MKVLIDTNVIYSGLVYSNGTCAMLLEKVALNGHEWVISKEIWHELNLILRRPKAKKEIAKKDASKRISRFLRALRSKVEKQNTPLKHTVPNDPKDDHVLSAAFFCKVDYLVSGDQHLLQLKNKTEIEWSCFKIVSPGEFLELISC